MKIELLMRSLDQEFSDQVSSKNHQNQCADDTPQGRWPSDYWPKNMHGDRWDYQNPHHVKGNKSENLFSNVRLRKEAFGGVLYDMLLKAVFKLDDAAYDAISLLMAGVQFPELKEHLNISDKDANVLESSLVHFVLCKV